MSVVDKTIKRSKIYFIKNLITALLCWVSLNLIISIISETSSLNDNYFLLAVFVLIAVYKSSYELKINSGSITIVRNGTVTANIIYSNVLNYEYVDRLLKIYTTDGAIFKIKLVKVSDKDSQYIIQFITEKFNRRAPKESTYIPNVVELKERIVNLVYGVMLSAHAGYGLYIGDIYVGQGLHMVGSAAYLTFVAMMSAVIVMLTVIFDHYDRRDNEQMYRSISSFFKFTGWFFYILACIVVI